MSEHLVDIQNLHLSFFTPAGEVKALNDVTIFLDEGEVLGIVGESGSGKSVTASAIMGITADPGRIVSGTVLFNGHNIGELSEKELRGIRGKEVSMAIQDTMRSRHTPYTTSPQPGLHDRQSNRGVDPAAHRKNQGRSQRKSHRASPPGRHQ